MSIDPLPVLALLDTLHGDRRSRAMDARPPRRLVSVDVVDADFRLSLGDGVFVGVDDLEADAFLLEALPPGLRCRPRSLAGELNDLDIV